MKLTKVDRVIVNGIELSQDELGTLLKNQGIIEQLEHRKKHPQAFNYLQFESWVTDILDGGNGFPIPKEFKTGGDV